jgi:AraC family transcriptional regulator
LKRSTLDDYKERMLRVLLYIQQHLDEDTPLQELAAIAAFSPYHFHRRAAASAARPPAWSSTSPIRKTPTPKTW